MSTAAPRCFAAVGDVHGRMDAMVRALSKWERRRGRSLDFVLQVGDFEPHRDEADLATMAAPSRYRALGDFPNYAAGRRRFPWPIYFVGGNHEPYGLLDRLAPGDAIVGNCTYLGRVGVHRIAGLDVAALSGIHVPGLLTGRPPIDAIARTSNKAYIGFTEGEVLALLEAPRADVLVVHEWPTGVIAAADALDFERQRRSMRYDDVGNDYARMVMDHLAPQLVLCGHMHRRYRNRVGATEVCALADVDAGADAFAFFEATAQGIAELGD
ncbi:MAG: metallophosphoesterase family protein [Myxococcales bacterium]|nr:metallophosphoesterase family protein [Myxococcales bacterium]